MGEFLFWVLVLAGLGGRRDDKPTTNGGIKDGKGTTPAHLPPPPVQRPPGDPLGRNCQTYDKQMWPTRQSILTGFAALGYPIPKDRDTMNALGADAKIGGGDDIPSPVVQEFQKEYNIASAGGYLGPAAGGLAMDGFVGPCTLNGLEVALQHGGSAEQWNAILGG